MHLQYLKRFYPDFKDKKILDLGCGRGDFLLECYKEELNVVGIDINLEYIKISEEKLRKNGFKPNIIHGKGENLPFENNYFDFINCVEVLEHTKNPKSILEECYRVLKNDAKIFLTTHNKTSIKDSHFPGIYFTKWLPRGLAKKMIKLIGSKNDASVIDQLYYFNYSEFKKMVKKIGFKISDLRLAQINNPELIYNNEIKNILLFLKKNRLKFFSDLVYLFLRRFYFNNCHILLIKNLKS